MSPGLPPGYSPEQAPGTSPPVILLFRIYSALLALTSLAVGLGYGGMLISVPFASKRTTPAGIGFAVGFGLVFAVLGLSFATAHTICAIAPRKPWVYTLSIVMLCFGFTQACCWIAVIPMFIYWLKPEVKAWYAGE